MQVTPPSAESDAFSLHFAFTCDHQSELLEEIQVIYVYLGDGIYSIPMKHLIFTVSSVNLVYCVYKSGSNVSCL